ncbi:hypothetical protein ACLBWT_01760 [Paenibacillus sp. D51F]
MATLTAMPTGFRVDLRPGPVTSITEPVRASFAEHIRAGATIIVEHIERHKLIYQVGALTLTVLLGAGGVDAVFAAAGDVGIDAGAERLYSKLIGIGRWVIIKGAFDTI